jgi:hypothetical protein
VVVGWEELRLGRGFAGARLRLHSNEGSRDIGGNGAVGLPIADEVVRELESSAEVFSI